MIAVIALSASVSCGELSHPQPTPSVITFTLTPTGCTAEGFGVLLSPKFDAIVVNNTSSVAVFNFRRLLDGHTYSELELFVQQRQQRIAAGTDRPELADPPWTTVQAQRFVNPGQTDKFEVELISGSYGLVCRRDKLRVNESEAVYVIGPFRVV